MLRLLLQDAIRDTYVSILADGEYSLDYLRNSSDIRRKVYELFSEEGEKCIVVGFVGRNAIDYLPKGVSDLRIICWPKAGGTNPDGVRRLINGGIEVQFCDRLHQKIYWKKDLGLIIASANLSDNALGEGGLHEFGVYCPDKSFDIDGVLDSLSLVEVTAERLAQLDIEHVRYARQHNTTSNSHGQPPSFHESMKTKYPKRWKLVTWSELRADNSQIEVEVAEHFGIKNWANDNDAPPNAFQIGDFVLQVKVSDSGEIARANGNWLLVDHIVRQRGNHILVQVRKLDDEAFPPFQIDGAFRKHFKKVFNKTEWDKVCDKKSTVKRSFVEAVLGSYDSV